MQDSLSLEMGPSQRYRHCCLWTCKNLCGECSCPSSVCSFLIYGMIASLFRLDCKCICAPCTCLRRPEEGVSSPEQKLSCLVGLRMEENAVFLTSGLFLQPYLLHPQHPPVARGLFVAQQLGSRRSFPGRKPSLKPYLASHRIFLSLLHAMTPSSGLPRGKGKASGCFTVGHFSQGTGWW